MIAEAPVRATDYLESHVNCRCTLIPRAKSYADILGDPSFPDDRPPVSTGSEEFAKLTPAQQAFILGPGKFALYQSGVPLEAFVNRQVSSAWGASRVAKPLYQLADELRAGGWSTLPPRVALEDPYANPVRFPDDEDYGNGYSEMEEWAKTIYGDVADRVTPDMYNALARYSGSGYRWMNGYLRQMPGYTGSPIGADGHLLDDLKEYLKLGRTPNAVIVYRGAGSGSAFGISAYVSEAELDALIGRQYVESGFMSTSLSPRGAFSGGVRLEISVPKGYNAMPISQEAIGEPVTGPDLPSLMHEAELLLRPGTRYVVESWSRRVGGVTLRVKVLQ